ncbi:ets DNA-binding protein pokkuri [Macrosteles quadrilineatus]|uniref:ets DNA-binding protein pokkuri n=1 Tax=Macrosteles quadrilineatus TaxID=74068 RepID=UPI0023E1E027|nr:ets DNA-binding protein pokkuri [Macrosteles quadrilineatus]
MKLVPSLPPLNAPSMERLSLFNPSDLLWRYPSINFPSPNPVCNYVQMDFKTHLPSNLGGDPRLWSREDVVAFLRWAEYEFDLPPFDLDMFQMNGKALCLLTKADLGERSPGNGDVLHNVLQMLIRDSRTLPSSPLTPHFPLTPSWSFSAAPALDYPHPSTPPATSLNSVTLSPAPSVDSQAGSPRHMEPYPALNNYGSTPQHGVSSGSGGGSSGSNQSDSEVEEAPRPPATPTHNPRTPPPHSPASTKGVASAFFPAEPITEPNTNGRLLWDFLQQLLNDSLQRYTAYIAWKNRDLGVFKIVDPPGLAKLWGIQKNHLSMNYDKMSRALRYYYRVNILRKVQGERHCYQFLRNPSELKSIKNISLLRQQMSGSDQQQSQQQQQQQPQQQQQQVVVKAEPGDSVEDDLRPTDLSIPQHFRVTADFEYLRNPSELKIMKNLHTLWEQRTAAAAANSTQASESQPRDLSLSLNLRAAEDSSQTAETQPRDLSLSLNLRATEDLPRPQDHPLPLIKTEETDAVRS